MKILVKGLSVIVWTVAGGTVTLMSIMVLYVLTQARWEANLKQYRKGQFGVYDRHGHLIETPGELLDQLMGIEERIAK